MTTSQDATETDAIHSPLEPREQPAFANTDDPVTGAKGASERVFTLSGDWTASAGNAVEAQANALAEQIKTESGPVRVRIEGIDRLDTLGALVLERMRGGVAVDGREVTIDGARPEFKTLLKEVAEHPRRDPSPPPRSRVVALLADVGEGVMHSGRDLVTGTSFLGEIVAAMLRVIFNPKRFRPAALFHHVEQIAFRGLPIVALISFLVGAIVAQQGLFQLQRFGAATFVVNLVGILVLRELAVLLTSIMVAGRSGSAFTAEIGSMKMREEIDALRVMGLDPIEVLVVPRILALIISLPLLTFLAAIASLLGAALVAWVYGDITPATFITRLQSVIGVNTFMVGIIKAPFMALVIGVIACIEGLAVKGSAESLGRQVTASVVKSIFMVIVVDGLFAMFFAAIKY